MSLSKSNFSNQVVVVTGGAQGIGACIVHAFIRHGAEVVFSDVDVKAGKQREQILNESTRSNRAEFIKCDLTVPEQVHKFVSKIIKKYPRIHSLINNAGIFSKKPLSKSSFSEWEKILAVNLDAYFLCSKLLLKSLAKCAGNIINIASTRAIMSEANTEPYAASKGGVVALTHSLAISLGSKGIRVNCISPGWIETSLWHLPARNPKLRKKDHTQHPVGRVGRPEDIGEACLFLASNEKAGFITGQNLIVDGGMTKKMIYVD